MSIDVAVKQKTFGNKTMPLEVILGENLHYGNFVNDQLNIGELGGTEFIAYHPEHIGRGFSVIWNPREKKKIELRLPQPSTAQELSDFYAAVERTAKHWNAKLIVDGSNVRLSDFLAGFSNMIEFNDRIIKHFAQQVLDGEHETLTLYSARWPLAIGKDEASAFIENTREYALWLHKKQAVNAHYAIARFYANKNSISARYTFTNGISCIFPREPAVPFGATDPSTGRALQCSDWKVCLGIDGEAEPLGEIEYAEFINRIPADKLLKYDGNKIQILEMSENEVRELIRSER